LISHIINASILQGGVQDIIQHLPSSGVLTIMTALKVPTPTTVSPAILKTYVLNGLNEPMVRLFELENNSKYSIVSITVTLIV